jgi:hypothetical protein
VEGGVGLSIAASVEVVAVGLSARGGDRADPAECSERCFADEPIRVAADGNQQRGGDVGTDTDLGP